MSRDERTNHVGSRSGTLSRRHALEAAGAGIAGVVSLVWSLEADIGLAAGAPTDNATTTASNGTAESASVANVSGRRWLSIHRSNDAAVLDYEEPIRTYQEDLSQQTSTASSTASPTASPTPEGPTTTHRLLFDGTGLETPLYVIEGPEPGPTGFVVGGMHGDELSGYRAAGLVAEWGVERGTLVVLPAANPPAIERETRYGRNGDLNRKFPPTADEPPTTRLAKGLWAVVTDYEPDWLIDLHSSRGVYESGDGGVGQGVFPTPIPPAPKYASTTVAAVNDAFEFDSSLEYRLGNHLDGDRPMLAHRAGTVLDTPAFILETAEVGPLDRQIHWHLYAVEVLTRLFDHGPIR